MDVDAAGPVRLASLGEGLSPGSGRLSTVIMTMTPYLCLILGYFNGMVTLIDYWLAPS